MKIDLPRLQREQHHHDKRNHADIQCLSKNDRLKHYGLHFAKYVGRLARGPAESKSVNQTLADAFLVALSAANTLHQDLGQDPPQGAMFGAQIDPVYILADATGRFADGCEKIDHAEEFLPIVRAANRDIVSWVLRSAADRDFALEPAIVARRKQLADRQFYILD